MQEAIHRRGGTAVTGSSQSVGVAASPESRANTEQPAALRLSQRDHEPARELLRGKAHRPWESRHLWLAIAALIGIALAVVIPTAPFVSILGPSRYALASALHGLFSLLFLVVATIGLYLGLRLYAGRIASFPDLQLTAVSMSALSFITIVFGNWIYIAYRAKDPASPRSYFLEKMPEVHRVFFEFKEYAALFTLPLSVAAAYILWRYGREILDKNWTRTVVALLMGLVFFYLITAFGLGAAVTKLKAI